jgi:hypothetical protein
MLISLANGLMDVEKFPSLLIHKTRNQCFFCEICQNASCRLPKFMNQLKDKLHEVWVKTFILQCFWNINIPFSTYVQNFHYSDITVKTRQEGMSPKLLSDTIL